VGRGPPDLPDPWTAQLAGPARTVPACHSDRRTRPQARTVPAGVGCAAGEAIGVRGGCAVVGA